jgi:TetR/AcrR family transcriptional regulator, multidrug resistance operon repressor
MNIHLYLHSQMRVRDENKELVIRDTALKMIVEKGFDGMSMQKLARAANVSPATLYIYYKNREDMLNRLYDHVQQTFVEIALKKFHPDMKLEEGLWLQWKNRMRFILQYPVYYKFIEQFRNSPQLNNCDLRLSEFKDNMYLFVKNAIKRGEMKKMEPELFWSVAYGPFYALIKFHLQQKTMMSESFFITETKMKQTLKLVVKALKP